MSRGRWGFKNKQVLEFEHTCRIIDENYERIEVDICNTGDISEKLAENIMKTISPHLEMVRKTNIAMREAADEQIGKLHEEVEDLTEKVDDLKKEIDSLNKRLLEYE